ncbi:M48 family metalloprotease [Kordiimonas pumila]|uniref:M48 family metalloprotease n=1 Tax=Kordiimonas pumila TaxID=2161677 RepID=A0ABV7D1B7_9PROT|nr:M48 family metalloprotease [Kordiimonas pumila]
MRLNSALIKYFIVFAFLWMPAGKTHAQSILRDAETEEFLNEISKPLFIAAGLNPESVKIYLLSDKSLNAFVTGGQNIFIHSGLFMEADNVDQLIGVIAHETGHISGGHLSRIGDAVSVATNTSIISMVLGAAAILAGSPDAGMGMFMAGQSMAQGQFLAYTRVQESTADQAGATFLEKSGYSGIGLIEFFEKLRHQEILSQARQDPYVRSHPLTGTRIQSLRAVVSQSPYYNKGPDPVLNEEFNRLKAKLFGYITNPTITLRKYPLSDTSIAAHYARVYAYHKALEWDLALKEADALIEKEPHNPFFYEIKGQILFENGHVEQSLPIFESAVAYAPHEPLVATALGQAMVSLEKEDMMEKAIPILEDATRIDPGNTFAWFNLAKAYSWIGQDAKASLATAERFFSAGVPPQAMMHARRAMEGFKPGTPEHLRAQDIFFVSQEATERMERQRGRQRLNVTFGQQQELLKE